MPHTLDPNPEPPPDRLNDLIAAVTKGKDVQVGDTKVNPEPQTLNVKPKTLKPRPQTLDPKLWTLPDPNSKPSTDIPSI